MIENCGVILVVAFTDVVGAESDVLRPVGGLDAEIAEEDSVGFGLGAEGLLTGPCVFSNDVSE